MKNRITALLTTLGLLLTMGVALALPSQAAQPTVPAATNAVAVTALNTGTLAASKSTPYGQGKIIAHTHALRVYTTKKFDTKHSVVLKSAQSRVAYGFQVLSGKRARVDNWIGGKSVTLGPGKYWALKGQTITVRVY